MVASEVKALAQPTAHATEQISAQIIGIRGATAGAVEAVREVAMAIGEVEGVATSIAAAVGQQAATPRETTNSVQLVNSTTVDSLAAMRGVLTIIERTSQGSTSATQAAEEVGDSAEILNTEVTDFLAAMSRGKEDDRRRYERFAPARPMSVRISFADGPPASAPVSDISCGGLRVMLSGREPVGAAASVEFPYGVSVAGRIARNDNGKVSIALNQSNVALARVDGILDELVRAAAA